MSYLQEEPGVDPRLAEAMLPRALALHPAWPWPQLRSEAARLARLASAWGQAGSGAWLVADGPGDAAPQSAEGGDGAAWPETRGTRP